MKRSGIPVSVDWLKADCLHMIRNAYRYPRKAVDTLSGCLAKIQP